jgi:hypothetical protein
MRIHPLYLCTRTYSIERININFRFAKYFPLEEKNFAMPIIKRQSRILLVCSFVSIATAFWVLPASAASYTVQTIAHPDDPAFTQLLGINNAGTVAGFHGMSVNQGFTLTLPNTFTTENFPGATQTVITAINGTGDTAGIYIDAAGANHGFTHVGGTFLTVDQTNTTFNQALGINNGNATVGYSSTDFTGQTLQQANSQSNGVFSDIDALLPTNSNSQAVGINNGNNIVGFYMPSDGTSIGFLDIGNTIWTIQPFGSSSTQALGINGSGEIVGTYIDAAGLQHGYTDIGGTFATFDVGSVSTTVNGVNDSGQLVGFYTGENNSVVGFVATPAVPEPSTISMLLLGLLAIPAYFRRNRSVR